MPRKRNSSSRRMHTTLTIWDMDETLFHTTAKIVVKSNNQILKRLTNKEFNNYRLKIGEEFDFSEFTSARHFYETSRPIRRTLQKAKNILKYVKQYPHNKMIILTARSDFDDKDMFLNTFRKYEFDIDSVYVERAGNLKFGGAAKNKRFIISKYLKQEQYTKVRLFDDSPVIIKMFKELAHQHPSICFEAYLVNSDGSYVKQ